MQPTSFAQRLLSLYARPVAPHPPTPTTPTPPPPSYGVLPYLLSKLAAELPVGALFPALFACLVYPATGLNPTPRRFASFLGLLTLEAMSAQVGRQTLRPGAAMG